MDIGVKRDKVIGSGIFLVGGKNLALCFKSLTREQLDLFCRRFGELKLCMCLANNVAEVCTCYTNYKDLDWNLTISQTSLLKFVHINLFRVALIHNNWMPKSPL